MTASVPRPLRVGLTGGIGSGKSTVAKWLAAQGAAVIDTDAISRELTVPGGRAIPTLRAAFGDAVIAADGALDRREMRRLAFADANIRHRLEAILHPMISADTERAAAAQAGAAVIVFDVPLLVESGGWIDRVDRVLVIDCSEATQIERVMRRSGWSQAAVRDVIAVQASREERRAVAHDVIVNDGITEAELGQRVVALWHTWRALRLDPL